MASVELADTNVVLTEVGKSLSPRLHGREYARRIPALDPLQQNPSSQLGASSLSFARPS